MTPIVYIDMLFLLNLLIDTITLYSASLLLKRSISVLRLFLVSVFLSVYSCAMFFPHISFLYTLAGKLLILGLATILAFPSRSLGDIIKNTLVFFSASAFFGGIIFALIFATNFGTSVGAAVSNGEVYLDIKASTLMLSLTISYICIYMLSYIKRHAIIQSSSITWLEISLFSKTIRIKAFADTGCSLCDPLFNRPAIIISPNAAKKLLPKKILREYNGTPNVFSLGDYAPRYCALPFCTIDSKNGILHGIVPDKIIIDNKCIEKCVIALSNYALCQTSEFDAIFNPLILTTENELANNI